jgi:hypothetical protein
LLKGFARLDAAEVRVAAGTGISQFGRHAAGAIVSAELQKYWRFVAVGYISGLERHLSRKKATG